MDQWDSWLDEYIKEHMPELEPTGEVPQETPQEAPPARDSGWYTGQRRPRGNRRPGKKQPSPPQPPKEPEPMPKPAPEPKQEPKPKQEPTPQPKPKPAPESDQQQEQKPHKAHLPKLIPKGHTVPRPGSAEKQPFRLKFHLPWKGEETAPTDSELAARRKVSSLRTRWLLNSMGAVGLVVAVVTVLAIVLMGSYFYTTMGAGLENKAQTAAEFFSHYQTESEYRERASDYVANFGDTDSIELEFLDTQGEIVLSSYAYQQTAGIHPDTGDITTSLSAATISRWVGRDPTTGERIMAVSAPVVQDGSVKGVIRMVTSMSQVDHQVLLLSVLLLAVAAAILLMIYFTNLYFVRSIAEPIAAITETTKRIAAGSYGVQMEKKYNDEIGELVDTINDMSLKVSQAEKMKSEFISSVSHELRTPLTAINGWGETLLRGEVTDPRDVHKGMAIIVSEAKRLTKMVEELLEFSRIEDGRFTLRIEPIDIKAELEDAVYTYREFFRKKGITLEYNDCEEDFPPIPGDPERLRQVFSNLLDNAAKHGGSGKRITVSIFPEGSMVAIRIRDYGHGIPPEELPHVKTKFYKGSSKVRGSGIGLAVCDEIAIRHNGSLTIENAQGGGCAVTLRLPVHEKS